MPAWLLRDLKKRGSYTPVRLATLHAESGAGTARDVEPDGRWGGILRLGAARPRPQLRIAMVLGMVAGGAYLYFGLLMAMG